MLMARRPEQQAGQHASQAEEAARRCDGLALKHIRVDGMAPEMKKVDRVDPLLTGSDILYLSKHHPPLPLVDSSNTFTVRDRIFSLFVCCLTINRNITLVLAPSLLLNLQSLAAIPFLTICFRVLKIIKSWLHSLSIDLVSLLLLGLATHLATSTPSSH